MRRLAAQAALSGASARPAANVQPQRRGRSSRLRSLVGSSFVFAVVLLWACLTLLSPRAHPGALSAITHSALPSGGTSHMQAHAEQQLGHSSRVEVPSRAEELHVLSTLERPAPTVELLQPPEDSHVAEAQVPSSEDLGSVGVLLRAPLSMDQLPKTVLRSTSSESRSERHFESNTNRDHKSKVKGQLLSTVASERRRPDKAAKLGLPVSKVRPEILPSS